MPLNVDVLALVGFVCESLFYGAFGSVFVRRWLGSDRETGAYVLLFAASIWVIVWIQKNRGANTIIVTLHCLLFVACTLHYALEFAHFVEYLVRGFYNFRDNLRANISLERWRGRRLCR